MIEGKLTGHLRQVSSRSRFVGPQFRQLVDTPQPPLVDLVQAAAGKPVDRNSWVTSRIAEVKGGTRSGAARFLWTSKEKSSPGPLRRRTLTQHPAGNGRGKRGQTTFFARLTRGIPFASPRRSGQTRPHRCCRLPLHAIVRGIERAANFFTESDRQSFLGPLGEVAAVEAVSVHAYVLMTNHVHLLVTPATERGRAG
jgi:hypothetical protein